jgi:hypothetical protein
VWVMPIVTAPGLPVTANERAALYGLTGDFFVAALMGPRRREPYDRTRGPRCPSNGHGGT